MRRRRRKSWRSMAQYRGGSTSRRGYRMTHIQARYVGMQYRLLAITNITRSQQRTWCSNRRTSISWRKRRETQPSSPQGIVRTPPKHCTYTRQSPSRFQDNVQEIKPPAGEVSLWQKREVGLVSDGWGLLQKQKAIATSRLLRLCCCKVMFRNNTKNEDHIELWENGRFIFAAIFPLQTLPAWKYFFRSFVHAICFTKPQQLTPIRRERSTQNRNTHIGCGM